LYLPKAIDGIINRIKQIGLKKNISTSAKPKRSKLNSIDNFYADIFR